MYVGIKILSSPHTLAGIILLCSSSKPATVLVWAFRWTQGQAEGLGLAYQIVMGKKAWPKITCLEE